MSMHRSVKPKGPTLLKQNPILYPRIQNSKTVKAGLLARVLLSGLPINTDSGMKMTTSFLAYSCGNSLGI